MNDIGLFIAAIFGWQRGKEWLAGVDERYIRNFRAVAILTIIGYTAFCGYAASHQWHAVPSIAYILIVVLGGLYISLSWQGLAAIAGLSAATKSMTPLKAIGYMALVFAIPTTLSEALMLGAITKPVMLFPLYVAGTVAGIYGLLWGGGVWFKRVIILSVMFLAGKALVGMYYEQTEAAKVAEEFLAQNEKQLDKNDAAYIAKQGGFAEKAANGELTPEQERKLLFAANGQPIHKKAATFVESRLGVIKVEYQVPSDIAPERLKPICGLPPGEYELEVSDGSRLGISQSGQPGVSTVALTGHAGQIARPDQLRRQDYRPYGFMLNGSGHGESVTIGKNGCALPSFNLTFEQEDLFRNGQWLTGGSPIILFRIK
jgi:hypothetical protein